MKILLKENLNFFKNEKLNKKFNFVNIFNKIFLRYKEYKEFNILLKSKSKRFYD